MVNERQAKLDELASKLDLRDKEIRVVRQGLDEERSAVEEENLKRMAKILNDMEPARIPALLLTPDPKDTSPAAVGERFGTAAKLLAFMSPEVTAKVFEAMEPVDFVRIKEKMKLLPVR
jgi:hypothetical protein